MPVIVWIGGIYSPVGYLFINEYIGMCECTYTAYVYDSNMTFCLEFGIARNSPKSVRICHGKYCNTCQDKGINEEEGRTITFRH